MQLPLGEDGAVATLGAQLKLKKNVFQGVVVQVRDVAAVPELLRRVRALPRLRNSQHLPHAVRVRCASTLHPTALLQSLRPEDEDPQTRKKKYRPSEDLTVAEDWEDDGEIGVGDRLLHVLQRWQVENVLLVVARQDGSLCGALIGQELFKLMVETAKLALEQYYVNNIKPSDAAKLEIFEAEAGKAQYIVSPRVDSTDGQQQQLQGRQQKQRASVCLMNSDTVESWPQHHQPTSDGGGRKVVKKGRVNHFLHGRRSSASAEANTAGPESMDKARASDLAAPPPPPRPTSPPGPEAADTLLACEGIDWLGITRDEWLKLRTIRVPVKELHYLFMCLVVLVEKPLEKLQAKSAPTSRQNEEFNAPSFSWNRCREVLQHTAQWSEKLRHFHGSALTKSQAVALRSVMQEPSVNETAFVRICSASAKLFTWLQRLLDEHDEHELGLSSSPSPLPPPASPVAVSQLTPQPPPKQPRQLTRHTLVVDNSSPEEAALVRELNAMANAKKNKIVDRGRLLSHKHLH